MIWRRRIAIVVLTVLAALPLSGAVCATLCGSAASTRSAAHHALRPTCTEPSGTSSGPHLRSATQHDCTTHDAGLQQASTTAVRADGVTLSDLPAATAVHYTRPVLEASDARLDYRPPPGAIPPTASPLVLRV